MPATRMNLLMFVSILLFCHFSMPECERHSSESVSDPQENFPETELSSYHCGTCDKSVTSFDQRVACEGCDQWFQADCQSIGDSYEQLGTSGIVWKCLVCDCANYTLTTFDFTMLGKQHCSSTPPCRHPRAPPSNHFTPRKI